MAAFLGNKLSMISSSHGLQIVGAKTHSLFHHLEGKKRCEETCLCDVKHSLLLLSLNCLPCPVRLSISFSLIRLAKEEEEEGKSEWPETAAPPFPCLFLLLLVQVRRWPTDLETLLLCICLALLHRSSHPSSSFSGGGGGGYDNGNG